MVLSMQSNPELPMDGMLKLDGIDRSVAEITDKIVNVSHHAMLVRLNISQWTARKSDNRLREQVAAAGKAEASQYNVIKKLLPPNALDAIDKIVSEARKYHNRNTLPWQYDGVGILYSKFFLDYEVKMRGLERKFHSEVEAFMPKYQEHISAARILLGTDFDADDYPHPMEVWGKFTFVLNFNKVEMGADFRVPDIGEDAQRRIQSEINRRANDAINDMVRAVWQQVHEHVNHVVERLTAYNEREEKPAEERKRGEGTFKDSLVENLRDLVERMPRLNITEDPVIDQMRTRLLRQLCAEDADVLRESPLTRNDVLAKAKKILADVGEFLA
jgi:hypothetical protein